ncbi:MAG: hypothetical protein HQL22_08360 [Candidatus Omnitrophica bacterium]|nr:hypothetical protein [Candidatus Omnitrophota bacterium]
MNKEKKELLVFGYGLGVVAFLFGGIGIVKHGLHSPQMVFLICGAIFAGVSTLDWTALRPGYRGWMKGTAIIGGIVTCCVLGAVFMLVFAPVGIILRVIGKDFLQRKFNRSQKTYWQPRLTPAESAERYYQQF